MCGQLMSYSLEADKKHPIHHLCSKVPQIEKMDIEKNLLECKYLEICMVC